MFRPQLYPNNKNSGKFLETGGLDLSLLKLPAYLISYKRDGVRAEIGFGKITTREETEFKNKFIKDYFMDIIDLAEAQRVVLEGELYSETVEFDTLSGILRSYDKELPKDLKFYCFDMVEATEEGLRVPFFTRYYNLSNVSAKNYEPITHFTVKVEELKEYFGFSKGLKFEGIVVRNPYSIYKMGRVTLNDDIAYKMKNINSVDVIIIGVEEEMKNKSESFLNSLGYKKKTSKKEDKVPTGRAGAFWVTDNHGNKQKVPTGMTDKEKEEIWKNKSQYLGKWCEILGMDSSKGKKKIPSFIRFRPDLDKKSIKEDEDVQKHLSELFGDKI